MPVIVQKSFFFNNILTTIENILTTSLIIMLAICIKISSIAKIYLPVKFNMLQCAFYEHM
jgi:hypothetical protein